MQREGQDCHDAWNEKTKNLNYSSYLLRLWSTGNTVTNLFSRNCVSRYVRTEKKYYTYSTNLFLVRLYELLFRCNKKRTKTTANFKKTVLPWTTSKGLSRSTGSTKLIIIHSFLYLCGWNLSDLQLELVLLQLRDEPPNAGTTTATICVF